MIDWDALQAAYDRNGVYALQLEIGDVCEQGCVYCYMNALPSVRNELGDDVIAAILEDSKRIGVSAIEWLGGEPLLRSSVFEHMEHAAALGLRNNMWTGGLPLQDPDILAETARLCRHGLIAFHLSTIDPKTYQILHPDCPTADMDVILDAIRRLLHSGYPAHQTLNSVTYTGLQSAEDMIGTIDFFESEFGIKTSLNVYHTYLRPGQSADDLARFIPRVKDVARVHKRYTRQYDVKRMPMNCVNKQYCSATIAVLCDGSVTGCATIREPSAPRIPRDGTLQDIFERHRSQLVFECLKSDENLPPVCQSCAINDQCWGCRSRAYAAGAGIYGADPRCPRVKDGSPNTEARDVRRLDAQSSSQK